jgi:3-oxoacyl-[acyl-carrier protein] reductase
MAMSESRGETIDDFRLAGQVAIVTGAGGADGIGFACARRLGALGAKVMLAATTERVRERSSELAAEGVETAWFEGDLTDPRAAEGLVERAVSELGSAAILVNNAGLASVLSRESPAAITTITDDQWRSALDRNLSTALFVTRAASPAMAAAGYGRIVNVSSVSGPVAAYEGDVGYHAAKAGMVGLTRSAAIDLAASGVTVNAVAPGWIRTAATIPEEVRFGEAAPVGRPGTPDEVATLVVSLCLPGNSYLTGQLITVDGGNSIAEERG